MDLIQILVNPENFPFYYDGILTSPSSTFKGKNLNFGSSEQPYKIIPPPEKVKFNTPIDYIPSELNIFPNLELFNLNGGGGGDFGGSSFTKGNEFSYLGSVLKSAYNSIRYNPRSWGPDFLNRGNLFGFIKAADDVERLTKYFKDIKGSGPLFIIKQNLLSAAGIHTEATNISPTYGGGYINEGVYLPTSTIAQSATGFLGTFFNKQGIDFTGLTPLLRIQKYQDAIYRKQIKNNEINKNPLVELLSKDKNNIKRYLGGPGSVYGIGYTTIRYATDSAGNEPIKTLYSAKQLDESSISKNEKFLTWGKEKFLSSSFNINSSLDIFEDFRTFITSSNSNIFLSQTTGYSNAHPSSSNIEKRISLGNPSMRGNRSNPELGKKDLVNNNEMTFSQDLINKSLISSGSSNTEYNKLTDLIKFEIEVFDYKNIANNTLNTNKMKFRVFLKGLSDSYDGNWKSMSYVGRGESFYKYEKFKRDVNFSFIVAVFSKEELNPIYKKLNYLASTVAPYYSEAGYMSGNMHRITLGDWLIRQPGFISSVDLTIPEDSPWEINLTNDPNTQQLPHMVEVKIKFTPIHRFAPQISMDNYFFGKKITEVSSPLTTQLLLEREEKIEELQLLQPNTELLS